MRSGTLAREIVSACEAQAVLGLSMQVAEERSADPGPATPTRPKFTMDQSRSPPLRRASGLAIALAVHVALVAVILWPMVATKPSPIVSIHVSLVPSRPAETPPVLKPSVAPPVIERVAVHLPVSPVKVVLLQKSEQPTEVRPIAPPPLHAISAPPRSLPIPSSPAPPSPVRGKPPVSFQEKLLAQLERYKRYPHQARLRGQQGIVALHFKLDRQGHVLSSSVAASSGFSMLDDEALALLDRAQPLPPIPDDIHGETLDITVPISFSLQHG